MLMFNRKKLKCMIVITIFLITIGFPVSTHAANEKVTKSLQQKIESIKIFTGMIDVEGEGVIITLTDNELNKDEIYKIIHDVDIVEVVNELTKAGAEVISVNDERLIPISEIKANKMMIEINDNEYSSPFIIKAIGNAEKLYNAVSLEDSYINLIKKDVGVKIEKKDKIFIPKYKGDINFKYAKPVNQ